MVPEKKIHRAPSVWSLGAQVVKTLLAGRVPQGPHHPHCAYSHSNHSALSGLHPCWPCGRGKVRRDGVPSICGWKQPEEAGYVALGMDKGWATTYNSWKYSVLSVDGGGDRGWVDIKPMWKWEPDVHKQETLQLCPLSFSKAHYLGITIKG